MKSGLKVLKLDGSVEDYLHTKVMATISNALASAGEADIQTAEQLAEVITYQLYNKHRKRTIGSNEIFSIVKAILSTTGFEQAAIALQEHYYRRKIKRSRIEVFGIDLCDYSDAELFPENRGQDNSSRWDKSRIVRDLVNKHGIEYGYARAIASTVEEKVFGMNITYLPASLVKQLVLNEAAQMRRAILQLETV